MAIALVYKGEDLSPIAERLGTLVARLRDLGSQSASPEEDRARDWLEGGRTIFEEIDQVLHRAGLDAI
ncbi:MAG: hypothetical protein HC897_13915 [Thermoanaerobaculia bacterium]|nr:hypothetical protein [Thermoanaerobaculia bacterium]